MPGQPAPRPWASLVVAIALATLLFAIGVFNRVQLARVVRAQASVAHTYAVEAELAQTLSTLVDAETGQRGFIITGVDRYLEPYDAARANLDGHLRRLTDLTVDNPDQQGDIRQVRTLAGEKMSELAETIAARRTGGIDAAARIVTTDRGKRAMDDLRGVTARIDARERALLDVRLAEVMQSSDAAALSAMVSTALAMVAVGLIWAAYRRHSADRARAAMALASEHERLCVTVHGIGDGVIAVDPESRITLMNRVAETLTGFREREAIGKPVTGIFHIVNEETRRIVENPLAAVFRTGAIQGLANHTLLIAADGAERPIDDSAAPLRDIGGHVIGAVLVFRDVSQRRAAERRVRDALELAEQSRAVAEGRQRDLEQAINVKNQFLAAVSHELRTPINSIVGWASMLRQGTMRPERSDAALESVERNARTLSQLIEDLLESSRLLTGKVRLSPGDVDTNSVIADAVDAVRLSAENKNVLLEVDAPRVPGIRGDGERLKQVLWNVLGNAIKFTPAGGRVLLNAGTDGDAIRISVSDTGDGIEASLLPYVFEHFRQGDEHSGAGLGLGLAIAKQLVDLHGGTIDARSAGPAQGATFIIRIPSAAPPA